MQFTNVIRVIKIRDMTWEGHVACMRKYKYINFVVESQEQAAWEA